MKPNPRRQNGHRRNQLRARVLARDNHCWAPFCGQPVDKTLPPGLDASPEVHEIIPVSRGGDPLSLDNCVLTHRACNRSIGNRTPNELHELAQPKQAVETGFEW